MVHKSVWHNCNWFIKLGQWVNETKTIIPQGLSTNHAWKWNGLVVVSRNGYDRCQFRNRKHLKLLQTRTMPRPTGRFRVTIARCSKRDGYRDRSRWTTAGRWLIFSGQPTRESMWKNPFKANTDYSYDFTFSLANHFNLVFFRIFMHQ